MKQYPKYPISISALAFSPDGTKLAIGASNEYDNSTPPIGPETMQVLLMVKDTVMEDSKVRHPLILWRVRRQKWEYELTRLAESQGMIVIPYLCGS